MLVLIVARAGYDRRAFRYQAIIMWALLLASWRLTKPEDNVNWVHSLPGRIRSQRVRAGYVALLMAALPLVFHLPAHLFFTRAFRAPES